MTAPEPVLLAWSGGKDCALALARLREDASVRVAGLLTTVTAEYDRVSIHGVRRALLHAQAEALGIPLHEAVVPPRASNDVYERAMGDALREVRRTAAGIHRIAYGDIHLADVRRYREDLSRAHGFASLFPLWGERPAALAEEVLARGMRARLVCVDTEQLAADFAGRAYDRALLDALPPDVDPCGERGEFHTFVSAGPGFLRQVAYAVGETVVRDGRFAFCDLLPA